MRKTILGLGLLTLLAAPALAEEPAKKRILFGIQTGQQDVTYAQVKEIWKEAETLGFDSAWNFDHLAPIRGDFEGPCLEGWTMLGGLAEETERLRIGTLVTANTFRNPALLAKMATTVDEISNGRLYLGIGAAWFEKEHVAYGIPFGTAKERADRLDEALQVIKKLWGPPPRTFQGKYYSIENAPWNPAGVQKPHPPIVVGGKGKKWIMPLVARYADAWNVPIGVSPAGIRSRREIIRKECERVGRTPCDIEVQAFLVLFSVSDIPLSGPITRFGARLLEDKRVAQAVLAGTPNDIAERIQMYVDAGATHIIVNIQPPYDKEMLRRFATEVMPRFR